MEVQRERYGPALYTLTKLVLAVRLYLHLSLAYLIWTEENVSEFLFERLYSF